MIYIFAADSLECIWEEQSISRLIPSPLSGNPHAVPATNITECQESCIRNSEFLCVAAQFKPSEQCCVLLETLATVNADKISPTSYYVKRPLCAGSSLVY